MRLPVNRASALTLAFVLAACGSGGGDGDAIASTPMMPVGTGPAADYPVVLGQPFVVDGVTYTPEDKLNFDQVGYATLGAGEGVSIAHRTLPMPSYAEVTSLQSGKTILVRVTRRGPMTGSAMIELSAAAAAQLGIARDRAPIRIRRVNPPEIERAALRAGGQAPSRMDTPVSLVNVLRRKLDPGMAALPMPGAGTGAVPLPAVRPVTAPMPEPVAASAVKKPPVPAVQKPAPAAVAATPVAAPTAKGSLIVQIGAYSSEARSGEVARKLGGRVSPAGKLFRVRMGPFSSRGEADAALAKAKAAGYSEARIQRAD